MPLPSQSQGSDSRRSYMYRRARPRGQRFMVPFLVLIVGAIGLWFGLPAVLDIIRGDDANQESADSGGNANDSTLVANNDDQDDENIPAIARQRESFNSGRDFNPPNPRENTTNHSGGIEMGGENTAPRTADPDPDPVVVEDDPTPPRPAANLSRGQQRMQQGFDLLAANDPVEGRRILTRALVSGELSDAECREIRSALTEVNERLVFSPYVIDDDPFSMYYRVKDGDILSKIVRTMGIAVDWRFISRVNGIDPRRIRAGKDLKLITGPFHAIVDKSDYRLDLFLGEGEDLAYVRSFRVGLGEENSTPIGLFGIRSRLANPDWRNPRTGEYFEPEDPKNPIGEHWVGLEGLGEAMRDIKGYGIHGTIDLDSIGHQESMGCVRLGPEDIALLFEVLLEDVSTVEIRK